MQKQTNGGARTGGVLLKYKEGAVSLPFERGISDGYFSDGS
jgi:hypothetical protein